MSARRVSETGGVAGRRRGRPTVLLAVCASLVLACQANGPYEPVHCDESLALERAGTWRSEIDVLQVAQADDDVAELCDHGSFFGDCPSSGADWVIELPPAAQEPGVHKNSADPGVEPFVYCNVCVGGPEDGGWWTDWDEGATVEITAIDDEHIAGCIVGTPDAVCIRESIRFDVPCGANG
jgi:hypothetical protein